MQNHGDFIFHLDEPREQFESGRKKLRGWIASQDSLGEIRLRGESERAIALRRLQCATTAEAKWNAALAALLFQFRIARGDSFRREEADRIIALFAEIFPEAFIVQIGANDGSAGDPLVEAFSKTGWSG